MEHQNEIGFQIHTLSHLIRHTVNQMAFSEEEVPASGIQGRIIGYLYENRGRDVFQRDIQSQFSIRRSTVTGTLQLMEKNDLVIRRPVEWDARLKKLELTPKALELHEHIVRGIRRMEETLASTLTPEEKETFILLCGKVRDGLIALQSSQKA